MKGDDLNKKINEDDRPKITPNDVWQVMMKDRDMSFAPGGAYDVGNAPIQNYAIAYSIANQLNKDRADLRGSDKIDLDTVSQDDIKDMMAKFAKERGADRDQQKFADMAQASRTRAFNKDQANKAQDKFASNAEQMRRSEINKRIAQGIKDPDYSDYAKDLEGLKNYADAIADLRGTMDNDIASDFALRKALGSQGQPADTSASNGEWRGVDPSKTDAERVGVPSEALPMWAKLSQDEKQQRIEDNNTMRQNMASARDEINKMLQAAQNQKDLDYGVIKTRLSNIEDWQMPSVGAYERQQVANAIANTAKAVNDVIGPEAVVGYANDLVDITDAASEASVKFLDNAIKPAWQTLKKQAPQVAGDIINKAAELDNPVMNVFIDFMNRISRTTISINLTDPLNPEFNMRTEDFNNNKKTLQERAELMEWGSAFFKALVNSLRKNRQNAAAKNTASNAASRAARDANRNPNVPYWLGGRAKPRVSSTRGQDPATMSDKDFARQRHKDIDAKIDALSKDEPLPDTVIGLEPHMRVPGKKPSSGFVSPEERDEIVSALRQANPMAGVQYPDEFAATLPDQELRDLMRSLDTPEGMEQLGNKVAQWQKQLKGMGITEAIINENTLMREFLKRLINRLNDTWDSLSKKIDAGEITPEFAADVMRNNPSWNKAREVQDYLRANPDYQDVIPTTVAQRLKAPDQVIGRGGVTPPDEIDAANAARDAALDISGRTSRKNPNPLPDSIPGSMGAFEQKEEKIDEISAGGVASVAQPMPKKRKKTNEQALTEEQFDEAAGEKDACYHKVKSRYKVWPSAYASGALVKCRKVGAKNWGNSKKK